jgi:CRISPR-associated protein Csx17
LAAALGNLEITIHDLTAMPTLTLHGCAPVPLAHYLKALGILRLVAEQLDTDARASWKDDRLVLHTTLSPHSLVKFFNENYRPSPVLAPWNGGSGFFPKDNDEALSAIEKSASPRLAAYRESIEAARSGLKSLGLKTKPEGVNKTQFLQSCRNSFPETALCWLDAVFILSQDSPKFPPLVGTGGNDGRLEFTNNFMQRLIEVMDVTNGTASADSDHWIRAALFAEVAPSSAKRAPIGQFFPGAAGGANGTCGFDAASAVNPWDFILMIEGTLLFAAATLKQLESMDDGSLAYPFCVRQTSVGYSSAARTDESEARCEMWMPLWTKPTTLSELRAIFSEGRAQVRGRSARTGVDFSQAAVTLGVACGVAAFQRYGFQVRNGLAYFATPLDRVVVRRNAKADLLADIEHWHDRLRQKSGPRANPAPPASIARALGVLENRIVELCRNDSHLRLLSLLSTLGATERALADSVKWAKESHIRPLSGLRPDWLLSSDNGSVEFRLAQSLAGMRAWIGDRQVWFREQLEPIDISSTQDRSWVNWADLPSNDVTWHGGDLTDCLNAILARRLIRVQKTGALGWPDWSPRLASFDDITAYIEGRVNEPLLANLIWGLALVDWSRVPEAMPRQTEEEAIPSSFYALLRLCFRRSNKGEDQEAIPLVPAILHRAIAGDGSAASQLASRRLRASGFAPLVSSLPVGGNIAKRTAAAMLFPIATRDLHQLERMILQHPTNQIT